MHFNHILLTTDFSDASKKAFDFAAFQHQLEGTKVTLLHVTERMEIPMALQEKLVTLQGIDSFEENMLNERKQELEKIWSDTGHKQDIEIKTIMAESASAGICQYAKDCDVDLIIMARRGRGVITEFLLGTSTQRVLRHAHCPVMVIPV